MSARNNNQSRTTSTYVPRVPSCKVCKDAGEPENVYTSHYVKDREGNVSCPKLKAIVCLNCGKRGHTSSYCKAPITKQREEQADTRAAEAAKKPAEPVAKGRFACLFEDDSDDENKLLARKHTRPTAFSTASRRLPPVPLATEKANPINVSNVFDFPSLSASIDTKASTATKDEATATKPFSYANMAAKPAELKPVRQTIVIPTRPVRPASPTTLPPGYYGKKASELEWDMEADSDDDSDYDEDI